MANPLVRGVLEFYPEDAGQKLKEARQACRWLHEMDPHLLTPMHRMGRTDYYIFEIARLKDGSLCMPFRWFQKNNIMWFRAWKVTVYDNAGRRGWVIEKGDELSFSDETLSMSNEQLRNGVYLGHGYPPITDIVGELISSNLLDYAKFTANTS